MDQTTARLSPKVTNRVEKNGRRRMEVEWVVRRSVKDATRIGA